MTGLKAQQTLRDVASVASDLHSRPSMIAGVNPREYAIKRPHTTESNWRYRPQS